MTDIYMCLVPGQSPRRGPQVDIVQCLELLETVDGVRVWRVIYEMTAEEYEGLFGPIRHREYGTPLRVQTSGG